MTARRARKSRQCDIAGCEAETPRCGQIGQVMCAAHWRATPWTLREALTASWRDGRYIDWSAHRMEALRFHRDRAAAPPTPHVTPERAYELQARLLGEH